MFGQQIDAIRQPVRQGRRRRGALQLQSARGAAKLPLRQRLDLVGGHAEPLQEFVGAPGPPLAVGDQGQRGTLRDGAAEKPVGGGTGQQRKHRGATRRFAENRHPVGVAAERRDVLLDPAQSGELVPQREVVVESVAEIAELESAENAYPVGDVDDHDVPVRRQPRPVVQLKLTRAEHERTAGDPDHHRQRRRRCPATTPSASDTPRRGPSGRRGHRRRTTCSAEATARARRHREAPTTARAGRAPETVFRLRVVRRTERRATPQRRARSYRADPPIPCARRRNVRQQLPHPNRSVQSLQP